MAGCVVRQTPLRLFLPSKFLSQSVTVRQNLYAGEKLVSLLLQRSHKGSLNFFMSCQTIGS